MEMTLREWQGREKPLTEYIFNASETTGGDGWVPFSIGVSIQFVHALQWVRQTQVGDHSQLAFCAFSRDTDHRRRGNAPINRASIEAALARSGIINLPPLPAAHYFLQMPRYKFVTSPEGNGIDCHRHYEALMAGCIPVVEDRPAVREKYAGCPILWTTDYSEITPEYLERKYQEMIDATFDFSALFLSARSPEHQRMIRENGDHWGGTCVGVRWYSMLSSYQQ